MSLKSEGQNRLAALILAAGNSSRLGKPKQLVEFQGRTLLENTIHCASSVTSNVQVILGANHEIIRSEIEHLGCLIHVFEEWDKGIGSTISHGISLLEGESDEILISVCDQPYLTPELLALLVKRHKRATLEITASAYGNTFGIPAIFAKSQFSTLKTLSGDQGAKWLMSETNTTFVPFEYGEIDIDTVDDLSKLSYSGSN